MSKLLYNGIELPALPDWDKTTYPVAVISNVVGAGLPIYGQSPYILAVGKGTLWQSGKCYVRGIYAVYRLSNDEWVWHYGSGTVSTQDIVAANYFEAVWTNTDIPTVDGSGVYLAASAPVDPNAPEEPVPEEPTVQAPEVFRRGFMAGFLCGISARGKVKKMPIEPEGAIITLSTTLPTAASTMGSAVVGNKVYLFGGGINSNLYGLDTINVFDAGSQNISTLSTKLPAAAVGVSAALVGTKVYLFGGFKNGNTYLDTISVFDIESQTINTLATKLPIAAYGIAAAAVGTKVYLFGGIKSNHYKDYANDTICVFDAENETISTLNTRLPKEAGHVAAVTVGSKVYLFGGEGEGYIWPEIRIFDTENETISTLATTLPNGTSGIGAARIGSKVYLFGGHGGTSGWYNTIKVFDIETETISAMPVTLPKAGNGIAAAAIGSKVYLFGGRNRSEWFNTINVLY